jgi:trehalose 6-phosphate synthase/phosphatase
LFFQQLKDIVEEGDTIWIHDYHFMLLPALVRNYIKKCNLGFFLHIPFPSFEIFRLIPRRWREELMFGILGADLVGFHTHEYSSHFQESVRKTLGFDSKLGLINTTQYPVKADAFPVGIDIEKFQAALLLPTVQHKMNEIRAHTLGKKIVFSVDRLDYTKGVTHRLKGFEYFLERYQEWHSKVVMQMVLVPSRDIITTYKERKKEIEATISKINGKYGSISWQPIVYQYKSLDFEQLVASYATADVGLVTPIRDGMNLVAKEYVACQQEISAGVLILSEMAGASIELNDAIIINPTDYNEVAQAIKLGLEMPPYEKIKKIKRMQSILKNYDVFAWATDFFNQLENIKKIQSTVEIKFVNQKLESDIVNLYKSSTHRALFFDYDGTLVPLAKLPENALPNEKLLETLRKLTDDPANTIAIISGRDKAFLETWFGEFNIHIFAEHGAWYKMPAKKDWHSLGTPIKPTEWQEQVLPILEKYTYRCNGSFVEKKSLSLAWHYRNVNPDLGALRSQELKQELLNVIKDEYKLQILDGNKVIEIKNITYNKGTSANMLLIEPHKYDFVFAVGDDRTDEDLFAALPPTAITIKVGNEISKAKYNFYSQKEVDMMLEKMIGH